MDWKSVGALLGPLAPTLGGIVGGLLPIPMGSMIGQEAGQMLANALGVPNDPNAIGNAITNDPNASAKIAAAESEAAAKWAGLADMAKAMYAANSAESDSINQTMRAELSKGQPWWYWRNLYGYSVSLEATATSWVILYAIVFDPKIFQAVTASLSFFLSWYGLRFGLLGYIHNQATQEKVAAVTGQQPSGIVNTIVKAVRNR